MDALATPSLTRLVTQMNRSAIRAMREGSYQDALDDLQTTADLVSNIALIQQLMALQEALSSATDEHAAGQQESLTSSAGQRAVAAEPVARAAPVAVSESDAGGTSTPQPQQGQDQAGPDQGQTTSISSPWIIPVHVQATVEENDFCMFQHAFQLQDISGLGPTEERFTHTARLQFLYSVILYNQGLAIQLWATVAEPVSMLLFVALEYYESALERLSQARAAVNQNQGVGPGAAQARTPEEVLLELSIRNNMGFIYCHLRNLEAAGECLTGLTSLLSTLHTIFMKPAFIEAFVFFLISVASVGTFAFSLAPAA